MRPLTPGLQLRAYQLKRRIGRGGEGDVWAAQHMSGRMVALKARPHTDDRDSMRFRAEFERLRTLRLPGVVRVLDTGADQGYLFFTMEIAEGAPFDQFMDGVRSPIERVRSASEAGSQVARALASIHRLALAHRDIKPANIHVVQESDRLTATVLDFGTHHFGSSSEHSAGFRGTPAYMAPEQRLGMPHDHRVDLFSLGTVLYVALSGVPAHELTPGQRHPSLIHAGPHIPLPLADLVDRMLALDPTERPSAEEAEAVLRAVASNLPLPPTQWPKPVRSRASIDALMDGHAQLIGGLGDGVERLTDAARTAWYRKGYPSVMGRCDPSIPYGPWVAILAQLFQQRSPMARAQIAGDDLPVLHGIWPEIPVPSPSPYTRVPDAAVAGAAIAGVLNRCGPIAVVLRDLHHADLGTAQSLGTVLERLDSSCRIWGTSRSTIDGLRMAPLEDWGDDAHAASWAELFGDRTPCPPQTERGREFLRIAWTELARERNVTPPPRVTPAALQRLSVLSEPFPKAVAVQMAPDLDRWIEAGHLMPVQAATDTAVATLRFANQATRTLAAADNPNPEEAHRLAALAWDRFPEAEEAVYRRTKHLLYAGTAKPSDVANVIHLEVNRERPVQIRRWLDLFLLHLPPDRISMATSHFEVRYARLLASLHIAPSTIHIDDIRELAVAADSPQRRCLYAHLKLAHSIRTGDAEPVLDEARKWAQSLATSNPVLSARMFREIALAYLGTRQNSAALRDSRSALALARTGAASNSHDEETTELDAVMPVRPKRLTQPEIDAATTYSAALVYEGRPREAARLCGDMAARCANSGYQRGAAAFLVNRAIALHRIGDRSAANESLAEANSLQFLHGDVLVFSNQAVCSARLAVERADRQAAPFLLDEAITAAQGVDDPDLLAEAWTTALDFACQTGSATEARRALSTYGSASVWSPRDHWPAALARWQWSRGALDQALLTTESTRIGYGAAAVQAEHARLLLVTGDESGAVDAAMALMNTEGANEWRELHQFAQLIVGAARAVPDAAFNPLVAATRESRWVHLYLGALHLDAVRRKTRGENVMPLLRRLKDRAQDVGHRMYLMLADPSRW
ncbi:MAG: serine/threonine-protein kinase [Myxococcota bacterium]|jgi:serine/threonine-protein kinase|nr:serine/threonine-protein kinase [Myxococcota bacterium]